MCAWDLRGDVTPGLPRREGRGRNDLPGRLEGVGIPREWRPGYTAITVPQYTPTSPKPLTRNYPSFPFSHTHHLSENPLPPSFTLPNLQDLQIEFERPKIRFIVKKKSKKNHEVVKYEIINIHILRPNRLLNCIIIRKDRLLYIKILIDT